MLRAGGGQGSGGGSLHHHLTFFSTLTCLFLFFHYLSFPSSSSLWMDRQLITTQSRSSHRLFRQDLGPPPAKLRLFLRERRSLICVSVVIKDYTIQAPRFPSRHSLCTFITSRGHHHTPPEGLEPWKGQCQMQG